MSPIRRICTDTDLYAIEYGTHAGPSNAWLFAQSRILLEIDHLRRVNRIIGFIA